MRTRKRLNGVILDSTSASGRLCWVLQVKLVDQYPTLGHSDKKPTIDQPVQHVCEREAVAVVEWILRQLSLKFTLWPKLPDMSNERVRVRVCTVFDPQMHIKINTPGSDHSPPNNIWKHSDSSYA